MALCINHANSNAFRLLLVNEAAGNLNCPLESKGSRGYTFIYGVLHRYNDGSSRASPGLGAPPIAVGSEVLLYQQLDIV